MVDEKHPDTFLRKISICCLFITTFISILTFIGWASDSLYITSINRHYKPISPSSILCIFILSVSFSFYVKKPENHKRKIIAVTSAFVVIGTCIIIFVCYLKGIKLKAEHLFFTPQHFPAGHMAPVTAAKLVNISIGILFLTFPIRKKRLYINLAVICAIISILTGISVLIGYLYESPFLYKEFTIPVSIPGAICILFLGIGLLTAAGPDTLPVRIFAGQSVRSRLTRAFLPVIIAAVFINDIVIKVLASFATINPALARSMVALASAAIVGVIIAKMANTVGTQIDNMQNKLIKKDKEMIKNSELFKMIAENINDGFWVLDAKFEKVIYVSPAYKKIRGKPIDYHEERSQAYIEDVYPEDMEKIISAVDMYKTGVPLNIEFRIIHPDGTVRWIRSQGFPVKDASGQVVNNVGIIRDITEQKQAEENLKTERDFSDAALNSLPAVFYLFDNTGRFLRWNKNVELITEYSAEEIESMHPLDFIDESDKAFVAEAIEMVFKKDDSDVEANYKTKSGRIIPYYFTARLIHYKGVPCVIGIGIDISERKRNALALLKEKETAQKYLDIAGVLLVAINADMEVILINRKACEILGYEEKEVIGKHAVDILVPEDLRSEVRVQFEKMLSAETENIKTVNLHNIVLTKKGERRNIEWNAVVLKDDKGSITGMLGSGEDVTERIKMENMIIQSKNEWEETFDTINDAITIHDCNYNIIRANKTAMEMLGILFDSMDGIKCYQFYHNSDRPFPDCPCFNALKTGEITIQQMYEPHLGRHLEVKVIPRFNENKQIVGVVHIVRDISDQIKAEEQQQLLQAQLLHMQKMESIGRLAGGVAHDFNNILSGILGFSELALLDISEDNPLKERIELIMGLGEKAGSLTQQLLAFSRKQKLVMKYNNINYIIQDIAKMLKRIIGEDIKLELKLSETIKNVLCDQSQLEQVLLNLAVNARDAMQDGGILTIETAYEIFNEENINKIEAIKPGEYVKLTLSDTGCGISNDILEDIFEPFFTTKELGKGTGLGLATVYGIIKQHDGYIDVTSKLNEGTSFMVYLPASGSREDVKAAGNDIILPRKGNETILVVDDEPIVLSIIEGTLSPLGYKLIITSTPQEALKISETYNGTIDLLLTDIIMPQMNGKQLADIVTIKHPDIKVMFMTGYPEDVFNQKNMEKNYDTILSKPIRINVLREKMREVLDSNAS